MNSFLIPFKDMPNIEEIRDGLAKGTNTYEIVGVLDNFKPHLIYGVGHDVPVKLIITYDENRAKNLMESYAFFDENVYYYPPRDLLFYQSDIHSNALTRDRIEVVRALLEGGSVTVVTTIDALMNKLPPMDTYKRGVFSITIEDEINVDEIRKKLVMLGYEAVSQVEHPGEFAVRGGIIDIYSLTEENPVRVELWGDEVDSLRFFDPMTQKSVEEIKQVTIYPAVELVLTPDEIAEGLNLIEADSKKLYELYRKEMKTEEAHRVQTMASTLIDQTREWGISSGLETHLTYFLNETVGLLSYFPQDTLVIYDEMTHIQQCIKAVEDEFSESMTARLEKGYCLPRQVDMLIPKKQLAAELNKRRGVIMSTLESKKGLINISDRAGVKAVSVGSYNGQFDLLLKDLKKYKRNKYRILLLSPSRTRAKHLAEILMDEDIPCFYTEDYDHDIHPGEIMIAPGNISRGYDLSEVAFVLLSEQDIFGAKPKKKKKKFKYEGEAIAQFTDLHVGDYVVHVNHGLGVYQGFEKIEVDKVVKDYIKISYAKGGNLYIPANQLDTIQKYSSADGKKPKLNTLGTQEWANTKARVQHAVGVVAKELVDLYAVRQQDNGFVYGPDTVWQQEFEEAFPYQETDGQLQAIEDVKRDMMSTKIMDRLICGDVGYGKTEVAIRAAFKAVQEGKQVAYLAPTTILAGQQYNTFKQRMAGYPVNIGLLNRFVSSAEQKKTIEGAKNGQMDIIIGTHRLLSADVKYKDLGLLIIDEEQRFGVKQKEKIKQMKQTVDVLSMSATPIPRSLHMSLIGIRDMSVLEEAPMERRPIQTFVFEYNEEMIREAILREMARGGQVYYVYNRVRNIADITAHIQQLVPEANVEYAHGKMTESRMEQIMYDFINGDIDVLVSTTIIEIGIDISNVNTIIIHDSDQLGLSQLYQLRGRVGRSNRNAYAFLMYKRDKMLKEVAEKRLAAIKEFTDLGSGFKIAMRDLEIRGAGNLLGQEQHGHMEAVGYDLYCKMLNEAVKREKGMAVEEVFETTIDLEIDAYLPENYVPSESQRLDIYKRIASIDSEDARDEMLDELIDRFGEPSKPVMNLLFVAMLRMEAHNAFIIDISQKGDVIIFTMYDRAPIDVSAIPDFIQRNQPYVKFVADSKNPAFHFYYKKNSMIKAKDVPDKTLEMVRQIGGLKQESLVDKSTSKRV
ncbi:MAG: transcription-repair coupling factor [Lachnospiraceae bacterium]|nr:transcription-repair coupling factor [Lachnospiraceae bacterium]